MKIAIFGATVKKSIICLVKFYVALIILLILKGNTGLELIRQALFRELEVTAIVRNELKLEPFISNPKFKVEFKKK